MSFVKFGLVLGFCGMIAAPALACDQQGAMAKATQLSQLMQAKMAKDASAAQALATKMQATVQSYQGKLTSGQTIDWDTVCKQYDDLIKDAQ